MAKLAKLTLAGTMEVWGRRLVPISTIAAGELAALLRLPVTVPLVAGARVTLSVRLWPTARVTGEEKY